MISSRQVHGDRKFADNMKAPEFAYLSDVSCKADEKYPVAAAGVAEFERWTGRMLSESHRRVIATLEWLRSQTELPRRVWVHDDGKCGDIVRDMLIDYMRWIDDIINRSGNAQRVSRTLVMARGMKTASAICTTAPKGHFIPSTIRRPLSAYGQRFMNALVLDADRCPQSRYGLRYAEMRRVVMPAAPECGMVIVHGNARRWSTLFAADFRSMASEDCPMTVIAANPVKERRPGWNRNRKRTLRPEEATLVREVEQLKRRLAEADADRCRFFDPTVRLAYNMLRESLRLAESRLAEWRKLHLPQIMERIERCKVLDLVYEIAPHIAREPRQKRSRSSAGVDEDSRSSLDAGDIVASGVNKRRQTAREENHMQTQAEQTLMAVTG